MVPAFPCATNSAELNDGVLFFYVGSLYGRDDLEEVIKKWRMQQEEERRETAAPAPSGWKSVQRQMGSPTSPLTPESRAANEQMWAQREKELRDEVRRKKRADLEAARAQEEVCQPNPSTQPCWCGPLNASRAVKQSSTEEEEAPAIPVPPSKKSASAQIDDPMGVFSTDGLTSGGFVLATSGRGSPAGSPTQGTSPTKVQIEKEKEDKWKNRKKATTNSDRREGGVEGFGTFPRRQPAAHTDVETVGRVPRHPP